MSCTKDDIFPTEMHICMANLHYYMFFGSFILLLKMSTHSVFRIQFLPECIAKTFAGYLDRFKCPAFFFVKSLVRIFKMTVFENFVILLTIPR